jgi:hypothetical protein
MVARTPVQRAEEPDVLVVDVNVDEPVQAGVGALAGHEPVAQTRVMPVEIGDQLRERVARTVHRLLPARVRAQDRRDPDLDCHDSPSSDVLWAHRVT